MKKVIKSSNYTGVKVTCKLEIEVEGEFGDLESDEMTARRLIKQDLKEAGWTVNSCEVTEGSVSLIRGE